MRAMPAALAVSLILTGIAADGASAATKKKKAPPPVCKLVKDNPGDATNGPYGATGLPNAGSLDIISADIVSNAKAVSVVIRVPSPIAQDNNAPSGRQYSFSWKVGSQNYTLTGTLPSTGDPFAQQQGARIAVDTAKGEIKLSMDAKDFPTKLATKAGTKYTELRATTLRWIGYQRQYASSSLGEVDRAEGGKAVYLAQQKACITVG